MRFNPKIFLLNRVNNTVYPKILILSSRKFEKVGILLMRTRGAPENNDEGGVGAWRRGGVAAGRQGGRAGNFIEISGAAEK